MGNTQEQHHTNLIKFILLIIVANCFLSQHETKNSTPYSVLLLCVLDMFSTDVVETVETMCVFSSIDPFFPDDHHAMGPSTVDQNWCSRGFARQRPEAAQPEGFNISS